MAPPPPLLLLGGGGGGGALRRRRRMAAAPSPMVAVAGHWAGRDGALDLAAFDRWSDRWTAVQINGPLVKSCGRWSNRLTAGQIVSLVTCRGITGAWSKGQGRCR